MRQTFKRDQDLIVKTTIIGGGTTVEDKRVIKWSVRVGSVLKDTW